MTGMIAADFKQVIHDLLETSDFTVSLDEKIFEQLYSVLEQDPSECLELALQLSHVLTMSEDNRFKKLYLPQIDDLLKEIAIKVAIKIYSSRTAKSETKEIIIASEFYVEGGHNSIAKKFLDTKNSSHLVVTDCFRSYENKKNYVVLFDKFLDRTRLLEGSTCLEKVISLTNFLLEEQPRKVLIISHPQDPIPIVAALLCHSLIRFDFVHHADHSPCIGLTLDIFQQHIDCFEHQAKFCAAQGVSNVGLRNLYPDAWKNCKIRSVNPKGRLLTIGSQRKFSDRNFYLYREIVKGLSEKYEVVHVGELPEKLVEEINDFKTNYKYIGKVSDLDRFLEAQNFDVFINSFPTIGGLSCVKAMSLGMPTLTFIDPAGPGLQFIAIDGLVPEKSLIWRNKAELFAALDNIFLEYKKYSDISKRHAEKLLRVT